MRKYVLFAFLIAVVNLFAGQRYTVIISLDGCRWDYPEIFNTPFLDSLGREGVKAIMRPSFPSKTFPNHYTLATGLVPDHHGIIANSFYDIDSGRRYNISDSKTKNDPSFYKGEPIWLTAKRQGVKVGVVYWPGSDVPIQGAYPDYYHDYNARPLLSFPERVAEVERLMKLPETERPRLVMAYFHEPDYSGHKFGPTSKRTKAAVESLDRLLEMLYKDLRSLPYGKDINFIVTSDHGMTSTSTERMIYIFNYLDKDWYERIDTSLPTLIFPKKGHEKDILKALEDVPNMKVWPREKVPAYLRYGSNKNVAPIVVLPDVGWVVTKSGRTAHGGHGFDPTAADMNVLFRAAGPDFKKGYVKPTLFDNTSIYPILCRLIGIVPAPCDGEVVDDLMNN